MVGERDFVNVPRGEAGGYRPRQVAVLNLISLRELSEKPKERNHIESRRLGRDDSVSDGVAHEIAKCGHLQLLHDLTAVQFDGSRADGYLRRNFRVSHPLAKHRENFPLGHCEAPERDFSIQPSRRVRIALLRALIRIEHLRDPRGREWPIISDRSDSIQHVAISIGF